MIERGQGRVGQFLRGQASAELIVLMNGLRRPFNTDNGARKTFSKEAVDLRRFVHWTKRTTPLFAIRSAARNLAAFVIQIASREHIKSSGCRFGSAPFD